MTEQQSAGRSSGAALHGRVVAVYLALDAILSDRVADDETREALESALAAIAEAADYANPELDTFDELEAEG